MFNYWEKFVDYLVYNLMKLDKAEHLSQVFAIFYI